MRAALICGLLAVMAGPVAAQDVAGQAVEANRVFTLGLDLKGLSEGEYFADLTDGLAGTWTGVGALMSDPDNLAERLTSACGLVPFAITTERPFTIDIRRGQPEKATWSYSYVYAGNMSFSFQFDAGELLDFLALNTEDRVVPAINMLGNSSSDALLYRPSPDILVIAKVRGLPEILARCPDAGDMAGTGTPDAPSTVETSLANLFEDQFGKQKPVTRDTFVACASEALSVVSETDEQFLIANRFNPPSADRQRIEAAYPDLADALLACGQAAQDGTN